jgi:hypothetical protein
MKEVEHFPGHRQPSRFSQRGSATMVSASRKGLEMTIPTPCTRHAQTVWMAYCPACTAWHLAVEIARRDGARAPATSGAATAYIRPRSGAATAPVGAPAHLAA